MSGTRFTPPASYPNRFREMHQPEYNEDDLEWLLGEYENNGDPVHRHLRKLLHALREFLDASAPEPEFRQLRNAAEDKTPLITTLNDIGKAIREANRLEGNKTLGVGVRELYRSAIEFVSKSVAVRLRELEDQNDTLFGLYLHKDNQLKTLIPPVSLRILAEKHRIK